MARLVFLALPLVVLACGQGTGPQLLPPYDGPLTAGPQQWTGYQPGSVDINDLLGGVPGGVVPGVHTYEIVITAFIDWNSADALAKQTMRNGVAGHLATITSPAENDAVEALRVAAGAGQLWLGGFQPAGSSEPGEGWTWVNGEGFFPGTNGGPVYANWAGGEPNNSFGGDEPYLTIGRFNDGHWNDQKSFCKGYVIEWDH